MKLHSSVTSKQIIKYYSSLKDKLYSVHTDKYDYSNTVYIDSKTPIEITCKKHGIFSQLITYHLRGKGCNKCKRELTPLKTGRKTTAQFITEAKIVHGDRYDYSISVYKGTQYPIDIMCKLHGKFSPTANSHLQGINCKSCMSKTISESKRKSLKDFIYDANKVHSNIYTYTNCRYLTNGNDEVTITCLIHGDFPQTPDNHLRGKGCPSCAKTGFDSNKPGILYYLKITTDTGKILYKIGITNKTVNERFNLTDLSKIEIIRQKKHELGQDAYAWEQKILKKYKQYQYKGPNILKSGNTELFTEDVMELYYKETKCNY